MHEAVKLDVRTDEWRMILATVLGLADCALDTNGHDERTGDPVDVDNACVPVSWLISGCVVLRGGMEDGVVSLATLLCVSSSTSRLEESQPS